MMLPYIRISTDKVPQSIAKEVAEAATAGVCQVRFGDRGVHLITERWLLGEFVLSATISTAEEVSRTKKIITQSNIDHFRLRLCNGGGIVGRAGNREYVMSSGDILLEDLEREATAYRADGEMIFMYIPRDILIPMIPATRRQDLHGVHLKAGTTICNILSSHIRALRKTASSVAPGDISCLCTATLDLLLGAILRPNDDTKVSTRVIQDIKRDEVKRFISENLSNPDLCPDLIMSKFRLSRTALYEMFRPTSGVSRYIITLRLRRSLSELIDPKHAHRRVGEIAFSLGFNNESHFCRVFRDAFGMSPGEVRRGSLTGGSEGVVGGILPFITATGMDRWFYRSE